MELTVLNIKTEVQEKCVAENFSTEQQERVSAASDLKEEQGSSGEDGATSVSAGHEVASNEMELTVLKIKPEVHEKCVAENFSTEQQERVSAANDVKEEPVSSDEDSEASGRRTAEGPEEEADDEDLVPEDDFVITEDLKLAPSVAPISFLREIHICWKYLYENVFRSDEQCIRWLAAFNLVPNERACGGCRESMILARKCTLWRCRSCTKQISVRRDSFFMTKRTPMWKIIALLYWWSLDVKMKDVCRDLDLSISCVRNWYVVCRNLCAKYFEDHCHQIGGVGKVVEIDEIAFSPRKYQRGPVTRSQWVLAGVERGSKDAFFTVVPNRSAETLLPIIKMHVRPGTRIITDSWHSYNQLPNHYALDRSLSFVDPNNDSIHTNTIEGIWRHTKDALRRRKGIPRDALDATLKEIQWRRLTGDFCFADLLFWFDFYRPKVVQ